MRPAPLRGGWEKGGFSTHGEGISRDGVRALWEPGIERNKASISPTCSGPGKPARDLGLNLGPLGPPLAVWILSLSHPPGPLPVTRFLDLSAILPTPAAKTFSSLLFACLFAVVVQFCFVVLVSLLFL